MSAISRRSLGAQLWGYLELIAFSLSNLRILAKPAVRVVFERQLNFSGVEALRVVAPLALLAGALVVAQINDIVGANDDLGIRVLIAALIREAGPLLAVIIVIARSGPAIASELALMQLRHEVQELSLLGVPPLDYLILPRVAAVTVAVVMVTAYFQAIATFGGLLVSAAFQGVSFGEELDRFLELVRLTELATAFVKSAVFGLLVGGIFCYQGCDVRHSVTEVPQAAIRAVMQSLFYVFAIDAIFAWLQYAV
jgi:phospholipid/cholesterol/gamma-HCH transport system permease protein